MLTTLSLDSCLLSDRKPKSGLKMKRAGYFILCLLILSCNSEEGLDCFKKQGAETTKTIDAGPFSRINISEGIELTVKESAEQAIRITAGKNLINDVQFEVTGGALEIRDGNTCGIFRNTSTAKVYIETPVLEGIYSASQFTVRSDGVLGFPELVLETGIDEETASSLFEIRVENESLTIQDNVSSVFRISGSTGSLIVNFWGSNGRLEAEHLEAEQVHVFHRSTNDLIVKPLESVTGTLYSTGNLILKSVPPVVEVEELYTGQIIYP